MTILSYIVASALQYNEGQCSKAAARPRRTYSLSRRVFVSLTAAAISTPLLSSVQGSEIEVMENFHLQSYFKKSFADDMEAGMVRYEQNMTERKRKLFSIIPDWATVVDLGIGTGPNLKYLPKSSHVIGIDPNEYMWPYAKRRAMGLGLNLEMISGRSENIPLSNNSCDVVITTLTLCSVRDVCKSLAEVNRILRDGGLYIFIEHVAAPTTRPVLRAVQNLFTPLQSALSDGCHLNRDIETMIKAQFQGNHSDINVDQFDAHFGLIEDFISPIRPHVAGYIRLPGK